VAHISPWLTTVGNSTHNRIYLGDAVLGNGVTVTGVSSNANTPAAPLILSKDAGFSGADPVKLAQCFGGADGLAPLLDPAKVTGKVLVCDRGNNVLVNKSANGKTAGAVGVIIANVEGGATTMLSQPHTVSTIHITKENGKIVKDYVAANRAGQQRAGQPARHGRRQRQGADHERFLVARPERGQRQHPETGPDRTGHRHPGRRHCRPEQAQRNAVAAAATPRRWPTGRSTPAPRWLRRTWPAWRRC
jgi:hypothetical protein